MKHQPLQILVRWFTQEAENLGANLYKKSSIEAQSFSETNIQDCGHVAEKFIQFLY